MNTALQLCLSGLLGAFAGGAAATFSAPAPTSGAPVEAASVNVDFEARIEALEGSLELQSERFTELAMGLRTELDALSRRPVEPVALAAAPVETVELAGGPAATADPEPALDAASLFDQILAADDMEASELWRRAAELGLSDEQIGRAHV